MYNLLENLNTNTLISIKKTSENTAIECPSCCAGCFLREVKVCSQHIIRSRQDKELDNE